MEKGQSVSNIFQKDFPFSHSCHRLAFKVFPSIFIGVCNRGGCVNVAYWLVILWLNYFTVRMHLIVCKVVSRQPRLELTFRLIITRSNV